MKNVPWVRKKNEKVQKAKKFNLVFLTIFSGTTSLDVVHEFPFPTKQPELATNAHFDINL
jgi:hypothetical protein